MEQHRHSLWLGAGLNFSKPNFTRTLLPTVQDRVKRQPPL
jgi:hypothetical protein